MIGNTAYSDSRVGEAAGDTGVTRWEKEVKYANSIVSRQLEASMQGLADGGTVARILSTTLHGMAGVRYSMLRGTVESFTDSGLAEACSRSLAKGSRNPTGGTGLRLLHRRWCVLVIPNKRCRPCTLVASSESPESYSLCSNYTLGQGRRHRCPGRFAYPD